MLNIEHFINYYSFSRDISRTYDSIFSLIKKNTGYSKWFLGRQPEYTYIQYDLLLSSQTKITSIFQDIKCFC